MKMGVLRPHEGVSDTDVETIKKTALHFFSLDTDKIVLLIHDLAKTKTSFTSAHISDLLALDIDAAYDIQYFLLHALHQVFRHNVSISSMQTEFDTIGIDRSKAKAFSDAIQKLDDNSKSALDVLYWSRQVAEDKPRITGLSYSIDYEEIRIEDIPPNLIPIVNLKISTAIGNKSENEVNLYLPISDVGRLAKTIKEIQEHAEEEIRRFKRRISEGLIVAEGG